MKQNTLSDLFKQALERHGSQEALAKHCDIHQSMVSLYISGKVKAVKTERIVQIARCLGVTPAVILAACGKSGSNVRGKNNKS